MKTTLTTQDIVYLEGELNYTHMHLNGGGQITSSYTLLKFEKQLDGFVRISRCHLINTQYIALVRRHGKSANVILKGGESLKVTRRRWPIVKDSLRNYATGEN